MALRCGEFGIVIMNDFSLMDGGEFSVDANVKDQNDSGQCSLDARQVLSLEDMKERNKQLNLKPRLNASRSRVRPFAFVA